MAKDCLKRINLAKAVTCKLEYLRKNKVAKDVDVFLACLRQQMDLFEVVDSDEDEGDIFLSLTSAQTTLPA